MLIIRHLNDILKYNINAHMNLTLALLGIGLGVAAAVTYIIGCMLDPNSVSQGLLVNLSAGFIGTIVTIFCVDLIIARHERSRWDSAKLRIGKHVLLLAAHAINSIFDSLGFEINFTKEEIEYIINKPNYNYLARIYHKMTFYIKCNTHLLKNTTNLTNEYIEYLIKISNYNSIVHLHPIFVIKITNDFKPKIDNIVNMINENQINKIFTCLDSFVNKVLLILNQFGNWLEPELIDLLLEFKENINRFHSSLEIINIMKTKKFTDEQVRATYNHVAVSLRDLLDCAIRLGSPVCKGNGSIKYIPSTRVYAGNVSLGGVDQPQTG